MTPDELAFTNFRDAVSVKEFEAVLALCKKQYEKVRETLEARNKFLENTQKKFADADNEISDESVKRGLNKLINALVEKSDKEFVRLAKDDLRDINDITEFLIRFTPDGEYSHLDVSFLNKYKDL